MVAAGLVDEKGGPQNGEMQYGYTLKPKIHDLVGQMPDTVLLRFQPLGTELINANIWTLELGSTILFFFGQSEDWSLALASACEFKKVLIDAEASRTALAFAKRVQQQTAK